MRKSYAVTAAGAAVLLMAGSVVAWTTRHHDATAHRAVTNTGLSAVSRSADQAAFGSAQSASTGAAAAGAAQSSAALPPEQPPAGRAVTPAQARVVKTASLDVSVKTNSLVTQATADASHIAAANGGYVASSNSFAGRDRQTTLTLRVPAAAFDDAFRELRRLGNVTDESLAGKDVTGTLVDLDARLRSLHAQEDALNVLIAKARTVGETLQVAQAASDVRMQIEQLAAQQAQLSDQADFATINLHVAGPHAAAAATRHSDALLVRSVHHAVHATLAVFAGVIVVIGYLAPLALLSALGYGAWRYPRKRHGFFQEAADAA